MTEEVKRGRGRPSKYQPEFCEQARKLCLLGATDADIAAFFGVSVVTIDAWRAAHPEFLGSLKRGKEVADAAVEERLFRRAMGYSHDAVKILQNAGEPVIVPYVEHYPPDTTACIFWLKNRRPDLWRDKHSHEVGGVDGKPIQVEDVSAVDIFAGRIASLAARIGENGGDKKPN